MRIGSWPVALVAAFLLASALPAASAQNGADGNATGDGQVVNLEVEAHDGGGEYWFTFARAEGRNPTVFLPPGSHVVVNLTNVGSQVHNLHVDPQVVRNCTVSDCATRLLDPGQSASMEFDVPEDAPMNFFYWCDPHRQLGMEGQFTTTRQEAPPAPGEAPEAPAPEDEEEVPERAVRVFKGVGSLPTVGDVERTAQTSSSSSRQVSADFDDALNGLALSNTVGVDVDYGDIADVSTSSTSSANVQQSLNYQEETVFSALALGIVAEEDVDSDLVVLAQTADFRRSINTASSSSLERDLDRNDTLIGIAMAISDEEQDLDLQGLLDTSQSSSDLFTASQNVSIDENDAFLALALGHGVDVLAEEANTVAEASPLDKARGAMQRAGDALGAGGG